MSEIENKNERQLKFNHIKGTIIEKNEGERFCSITIACGHEQSRPVNLVCKRVYWDEKFKNAAEIGDKVNIRFYLTSRAYNDKYNTLANILAINKETN